MTPHQFPSAGTFTPRHQNKKYIESAATNTPQRSCDPRPQPPFLSPSVLTSKTRDAKTSPGLAVSMPPSKISLISETETES